jgi:hypothetical protein
LYPALGDLLEDFSDLMPKKICRKEYLEWLENLMDAGCDVPVSIGA